MKIETKNTITMVAGAVAVSGGIVQFFVSTLGVMAEHATHKKFTRQAASYTADAVVGVAAIFAGIAALQSVQKQQQKQVEQ